MMRALGKASLLLALYSFTTLAAGDKKTIPLTDLSIHNGTDMRLMFVQLQTQDTCPPELTSLQELKDFQKMHRTTDTITHSYELPLSPRKSILFVMPEEGSPSLIQTEPESAATNTFITLCFHGEEQSEDLVAIEKAAVPFLAAEINQIKIVISSPTNIITNNESLSIIQYLDTSGHAKHGIVVCPYKSSIEKRQTTLNELTAKHEELIASKQKKHTVPGFVRNLSVKLSSKKKAGSAPASTVPSPRSSVTEDSAHHSVSFGNDFPFVKTTSRERSNDLTSSTSPRNTESPRPYAISPRSECTTTTCTSTSSSPTKRPTKINLTLDEE